MPAENQGSQHIDYYRLALLVVRAVSFCCLLIVFCAFALCIAIAMRTTQLDIKIYSVIGLANASLGLFAFTLYRDTCEGHKFRFGVLFIGRWYRFGMTIVSAILACYLIFGFELFFFGLRCIFPRDPRPNLGAVAAGNHVVDPDFGYVGIPGVFEHKYKAWGGYPGFDVTYSQNAFGRRIVPQEEQNQYTRHLAFFGCSMTFGTGCNDEDTLPAQIAKRVADCRVYNFAQGGYGPAQALSLLLFGDLRQEVTEQRGLGVYVFIEDHVLRAIGSMRRRNAYASMFPLYTFSGKDVPILLGRLDQVQPWRTLIYRCLEKEQFILWSGIDWPIFPSEGDVNYTAKLLSATRNAYCDQLGGDDFYVLLHPQAGNTFISSMMKEKLSMNGVPWVDFRPLGENLPQSYIFSDFHPTPQFNSMIADAFVQYFSSSLSGT